MNKQQLKYIGVAITVSLFSVTVYALFIFQVGQQADVLEAQLITLAEDREGEQQLTAMKKKIVETDVVRAELAGYYIQSTSDSIIFLNYIEQLAQANAVNLETVRAVDLVREEMSYLQVQYRLQGPLQPTEEFIQLLESIPYVSEVTAITLKQQSAVLWQADVQIEVAILE